MTFKDMHWLEHKPQWAGLKAVWMVECIREIGDDVNVQQRDYLCSICDLQYFVQVVREHWAIENSRHWVLDVQFGEDAHRKEGSLRKQPGADPAHGVESAAQRRRFQTQHPQTKNARWIQ